MSSWLFLSLDFAHVDLLLSSGDHGGRSLPAGTSDHVQESRESRPVSLFLRAFDFVEEERGKSKDAIHLIMILCWG